MKRQLYKMNLIRAAVVVALSLGVAAFIPSNPDASSATVIAQQSGTATPAEEAKATGEPEEEATGTPAEEATTPPAEEESGAEATTTPEPLSDDELINRGEEAYTDYCAACHQLDGQGVENAYPALAGNAFVLAEDPSGVLRVIFTGRAGMPHFRSALSNQEIAAIVSYIRNGWDNEASTVSAEEVRMIEEEIYSPSEPMEHDGASMDRQPTATVTGESSEETAGTTTRSSTVTSTITSTETPAPSPTTVATPTPESEEEATSESGDSEGDDADATPESSSGASDTEAVLAQGEEIYATECASCHRLSGEGTVEYPPLNNSELLTTAEPTGAIRNVLYGEGEMPAFEGLLSTEEIAAVLSYARNAWDNDTSIVTAEEVESVEPES